MLRRFTYSATMFGCFGTNTMAIHRTPRKPFAPIAAREQRLRKRIERARAPPLTRKLVYGGRCAGKCYNDIRRSLNRRERRPRVRHCIAPDRRKRKKQSAWPCRKARRRRTPLSQLVPNTPANGELAATFALRNVEIGPSPVLH